MISAAEMALQAQMTRAFIDADPEILFLKTRNRVSDGSGGSKLLPGPDRPPMKVRLIPQDDKVPEQKTSDGTYAVPEFILMAEPFTTMERWDRFEWKGSTWEITQIHKKPDYETKGDVVRVV